MTSTLQQAKDLYFYNAIVADGYKVADGKVSKLTKYDKIKEYNELYPEFEITDIKKMTSTEVSARTHYGAKSLYECYNSPSDAKIKSYNDILSTYKPNAILGVIGGSYDYSVLLVAYNGDKLLITKSNNYLVEEV